ncbi:MAG: potassium-transporting ATPase subunit F [Actinobacteria bacterium]|nr:MAG: potassium-transporting ATPase subunit F [Actinomycetota bacterium]
MGRLPMRASGRGARIGREAGRDGLGGLRGGTRRDAVPRRGDAARPGGRPEAPEAVSADEVIIALVAAGVLVYLVWALVNPEKL